MHCWLFDREARELRYIQETSSHFCNVLFYYYVLSLSMYIFFYLQKLGLHASIFLHAWKLLFLVCCGHVQEVPIHWVTLLCGVFRPTDEVKLLLLWMKVLNLLLRQLQYVPNSIPSVLPHFITLVSVFTRFGEDRSREGLLSKLGWGKKSEYAVKLVQVAFFLIFLCISLFVCCCFCIYNECMYFFILSCPSIWVAMGRGEHDMLLVRV